MPKTNDTNEKDELVAFDEGEELDAESLFEE